MTTIGEVRTRPVRSAAIVASYTYAIVVAAAVGFFLVGIPIQLSDCYANMLKLATPWRELVANEFTQRSYLRPFLFAELKLVYDASGGNFFPWFRGTHVVQVFLLVLLYVMLVRPRTWRDAVLVPFGLAVLLGMHTFRGTIVEAFPINTFLTVLLCCFAAAYLALMAHRWWVDVLAAVLFVVAALTVESGLLVAVIIVGAALLGGRGVSRRGVVAIVLLLAGYFVLRFGVLHVGSPGLIERSSGYGFRILDPPELIERFGANPAGFYAYNIVTSALSVLFAEPRGGTFVLVRGLVTEAPYPPAIVNVIANTCATIFIAAYAVRRRDAWRSLQFDHNDRLVLLFFLVWAANSVISYPYTKDVIMSPAGAFFALAAFAAVSDAVSRIPSASAATALASIFLCAVLGLSWAIRFAAVPVSLTAAAGKVRNEWAYASEWAKRQSVDVDAEPAGALLKRLRDDAIYVYPPPPPVFEHWLLDAE